MKLISHLKKGLLILTVSLGFIALSQPGYSYYYRFHYHCHASGFCHGQRMTTWVAPNGVRHVRVTNHRWYR